VSILNRLIPNGHHDDAALARIWATAAASGEPAVDDHLNTCSLCRARFDAFCDWTEDLRTDAVAEADAAFPAERLAAQQAQIFRRLEALERPARVIAFPKFTQPITSNPSVAYRWVAAAAAAGLIIGVGLGQWLNLSQPGDQAPRVQTQIGRPAPQHDVRLQTASATISDEALLSDLEASAALNRPVDPLRAIDTLTPRSRDLMGAARK
jgi:hypothetical protein